MFKMNCQIQPLQNHTTRVIEREKSSFLRAFLVVVPVFIYFIAGTAVRVLFITWFSHVHGEGGLVEFMVENSRQVSAVVNVAAIMIGVLFVLPLFIREGIVFRMPEKRGKDLWAVGLTGLCAAVSLNFLFGILQKVIQEEQFTEVEETEFSLPLWLGIILYGICSPLAEEIVFRGLVYNRLRRQYSVWLAVAGSSVLFGLYHGNLIQAGYATVLGILMAVLYERYGSFLVPVLIHSIANTGIYCIMNMEKTREAVMTPAGCFISGGIAVLLLWLLMRKQKESLDR